MTTDVLAYPELILVGVCQHKMSEPALFMLSADFSPERHFSRQCAGCVHPAQRAYTGLQ